MYDQRATQLVRAPRSAVYAALLDPGAVASWRVPDDMTARVHEWEPHEGGRFRVSLSYRAPDRAGSKAISRSICRVRATCLRPSSMPCAVS